MVVIGGKWLYSGKVVVFGKKWLYSAKSGCIRAKWFFGKSGCIWEEWLYSGKNCSGPTATVTSLKVIWNEGPDQSLQGKRLSSRDCAAYAAKPPIS